MVDEYAVVRDRLDLFDGCRVLDIGDSGLSVEGLGVSIDFKFENLPFESGSFDRIVIFAMLHHISVEERAILYKECVRLLAEWYCESLYSSSLVYYLRFFFYIKSRLDILILWLIGIGLIFLIPRH